MVENNVSMPDNYMPTSLLPNQYVYAYPMGTLSVIPENYIGSLSNMPVPDWIIPGILVREGLTLMYGESGSFKTTIMLYMAYSLVKGTDFFGLAIDKPYKVFFIEQDESLSILKSHIATIGFDLNPQISKSTIVWNGKDFNPEFGISLALSKADVVFIDAYTSLGVADITRPESALVFDALRQYSIHNKCSICIIHHSNLSGNPMGSSLHTAKVDAVVEIVKISEDEKTTKIQLTQKKTRGQQHEPMLIEVCDQKNLKLKKSSGTLKEEAFNLFVKGYTVKEAKEALGGNKIKYDTINKYYSEFKKKPNWKSIQ